MYAFVLELALRCARLTQRIRRMFDGRFCMLTPRSARRIRAALVCLFIGYLLIWAELPFEFGQFRVSETPSADTSSLAAALVARIMLGALYAFVAQRFAWARWATVALGIMPVWFVVPALPGEWQIVPSASIVTAAGVACRLAAALLLAPPQRKREPQAEQQTVS